MACKYCTDLEHPERPSGQFGMVLAKTSKGEPILVATHKTADGLTWFAAGINFCPKCGRDLRGDSND